MIWAYVTHRKGAIVRHTRPAWLQQGLVLTSVQEPAIFQIRRGEVPVDFEQQYEAARSVDNIRRQVEDGVTLAITNGTKAFGFEAEKEDIASSVRYAQRCHEAGLRVGAYIGETLAYETLFNEVPEAADWASERYDGQRVFWYSQQFRLVPCKFNPDWIAWQKRGIETAIKTIGVDFLHFDNLVLWPEPNSCHCEVCRDKFREFLAGKYTPEQRRRRLGFASVDQIRPPPFSFHSGGLHPGSLERIKDPLRQEWIDFRCELLSDMFRQLCDYARELKPDIVLECNPGRTSWNTAFVHGVDILRLIRHCHYFWVEDHNEARLEPDGRLITSIRTYKIARTLGAAALTRLRHEDPRVTCLHTAEAMAFNDDCIGMLPGPTSHPANRLVQFYRRHRALYHGKKTAADVAVLRSFRSLAWDNVRTHTDVLLTEQVLIQNRVPFTIVYDEHVGASRAYDVLVLAAVEFLSEQECERMADLVRNGLHVIVTGLTGVYDEMGRVRKTSLLLDRLGIDMEPGCNKTRREHCGKGRVAYVPCLTPGRPPAPPDRFIEPAFEAQVDNRYWHLPANEQDMMEAVLWCLGRRPQLEVEAGESVCAELALTPDVDEWLVHVVNVDLSRPRKDVRVSLALPPGYGRMSVDIYGPAEGTHENVISTVKDGRLDVTLPELDIYTLARVQPAGDGKEA